MGFPQSPTQEAKVAVGVWDGPAVKVGVEGVAGLSPRWRPIKEFV
jgi:hypothetical protein